MVWIQAAFYDGFLVAPILQTQFKIKRKLLIGNLDEGYEVVCFLANVGQEEDWDAVKQKAKKIGATKMIIEDLRKEFVEELCFRAVQCNAIYEGRYLLGKEESCYINGQICAVG